MNNVDRYLFHAFDAATAHVRSEIAAGRRPGTELIRLSMLIQVGDPSWNAENVIDCTELARMGNIVACLGSPLTVEALQKDPRVLAIEASRPASDADCVQSIPFINAHIVHNRVNKELGDGALIAIIDSDIDVLHEAFLDSNRQYTRILAIWDQTDKTGPEPISPKTKKPYLKGTIKTTEYAQSDINNYIQKY